MDLRGSDRTMENIIIGIAGGSGSGKSTFTNRVKKYFGDDVAFDLFVSKIEQLLESLGR